VAEITDPSMSHYNSKSAQSKSHSLMCDLIPTATSTYQNIPVNKYRSLPPNISPPVPSEQAKFDQISLQENQENTISVKSSEEDSLSISGKKKEDKKKKKKKSFFRRN